MAEPLAAAHAFAERLDAIQYRMHIAIDVLAIDVQRCAAWRAQRGMQYGTCLGQVDFLAGKHRIALRFDTALACKSGEQMQRFIGQQIL